jgi:hypothetical protein
LAKLDANSSKKGSNAGEKELMEAGAESRQWYSPLNNAKELENGTAALDHPQESVVPTQDKG